MYEVKYRCGGRPVGDVLPEEMVQAGILPVHQSIRVAALSGDRETERQRDRETERGR